MALLRNASTGEILATRVERATSFVQRALGLLPRAEVASDEGLWFDRCNAVHTIGMRARIDLIFLNRDGRVVELRPKVAPFQPVIICLKAKSVVELGAGALAEHDVLLNDQLELVSHDAA